MTNERMSFATGVTSNLEGILIANNGGAEGPVIPITRHNLNGHNFSLWSQFIMLFV